MGKGDAKDKAPSSNPLQVCLRWSPVLGAVDVRLCLDLRVRALTWLLRICTRAACDAWPDVNYCPPEARILQLHGRESSEPFRTRAQGQTRYGLGVYYENSFFVFTTLRNHSFESSASVAMSASGQRADG
eukprot:scaffold246_cov414-Prasinococcus_capsulatus_cf.AAC.3